MIWSEKPHIEIINGDCMEGMKNFSENEFDLAIVDPPYGIDLANMNMGIGKNKKACKVNNRKWAAKDWDKKKPNKLYFSLLRARSINQIIWGGNYFELPPCKHYIIWDKIIPNGLSFSDCEFGWTNFGNTPKMFRYSAYLDKKIKKHPTQKPIKLYKWLLKNYAKEGDKILDTHLGSGSIAIACYDMGFDLVGFEIDKDYYQAAHKRFKQHIAQLKLF
jgi:site-specific DNA-methyltransferase (adenine-specific)